MKVRRIPQRQLRMHASGGLLEKAKPAQFPLLNNLSTEASA
jgi:hypothetical protein